MKKMLFISILGVLLASCSDSKKEEVEFDSKKGQIEIDITTFKGPVKFLNLCEDRVTKKTELENYIYSLAISVKYQCKNKATYKPLDASFYSSPELGDTIKVSLKGTAENSYGVPGEITGYGNIVKGKLLDDVLVFSE